MQQVWHTTDNNNGLKNNNSNSKKSSNNNNYTATATATPLVTNTIKNNGKQILQQFLVAIFSYNISS